MDDLHFNLRAGYRPDPNTFDEMVSPDGQVREHWHAFMSQLEQIGPKEVARRWEQGQRLIHENGVTYNVYGDPRGMDRPWELDALPRLISAPEWLALEPALVQRAHVLEILLADLYGPQRLLRAGVVPPELVFSHPGFLRPCHGIKLPRNLFLNMYAADIVRLPDGRWAVISDRAQAPSGAGYALENRIVLSRIFPEVFKLCGIQRLANFFRAMRQSLHSLAPYNRDNPLIVLLSPGPLNETYFEHAYLARYLNYTLVEGGDLTVRDQCVYLKTLGGLHRVDVILRRLDAEFCDPLELRGDSAIGVPGLVQAVRAGNVAIANPLGSGVIETPAINSFLPALCKYLLGEELLLPSVPGYWCGRPKDLQFALDNFEKMVFKPAFAQRNVDPVFGAMAAQEQRAELIARIKATPHLYVAQEQVQFSSVPMLTNDGVVPRHAVLRTYLVSSDETYTAMPGGLTQVPTKADDLVFSLQRGGGSKDTWVQASGPVSSFSLLRPANQPIELSRAGADLPSRVADNFFWLGRYVERAESAVRLLRGIIVRLAEKSALGEVSELPLLLSALNNQRSRAMGSAAAAEKLVPDPDELQFTLRLVGEPGGLHITLQNMQSVARMVRDRLSNDTWRLIRGLDENLVSQDALKTLQLNELLTKFNAMVAKLASFGGMVSESMTRGQVWQFLDMGRRIERTISLAGLLQSTVARAGENEAALLEALLEICDSFMTYRRRYLAGLQLAPVLDLLMADETNPRSLTFQLRALNSHVDNLPRDSSQPALSAEQRITLGNLTMLRLIDVDAVSRPDPGGCRGGLNTILAKVQTDMAALSDLITRQYLSHAQPSRQLMSFRTEAAL